MDYEFSDGVQLIKNKEEWELLKAKQEKEYDLYDGEPEQYPCLIIGPIITYNQNGADSCEYSFVYLQDAQNLITEYWEQKDELR